jgi:predicted transcriptional regulator
MEFNKIHIGQTIKQKLVEHNISITNFAKAINCSRSNVYNIFESQTIDVERLIKISVALNYNFLQDYFPSSARSDKILFTVEITNGKILVTNQNSKIHN